MTPRIDIVPTGAGDVRWSLGRVHAAQATPAALAAWTPEAEASGALFWDPALGQPDAGAVLRAWASPGQLWHAGLRLGMAGQPELLDFAKPTWMLNRDPDPGGIASSWRLSLRACLLRSEVWRHAGGPRSDMANLDGAALELGLRYHRCGVLTRHWPELAPRTRPPVEVSLADQARILSAISGVNWVRYALLRAVLTGLATPAAAWSALAGAKPTARPGPFPHTLQSERAPGTVSVLIPTVDRYPYLRVVLAQLRTQTVAPVDVVVVDQTAPGRRDPALAADFADLPLRYLVLDRAGQCSSRNAGLEQCRGDWVLFLDDDDEIQPDLIDRHLRNVATHRATVSCGVADEAGAGPLPPGFDTVRVSDVFTTNNGMIRRDVLERSGMFDLAFDRGQRADFDLGMRMYLAGALIVLNPELRVFHHHAPQGGLRTHKARVSTYAASRKTLTVRNLPTPSEFYLGQRYFTERQRREARLQRLLGVFAGRGGAARRLLRVAVQTALLGSTLQTLSRNRTAAADLLRTHPTIPFPEGAPRT